MLSDPEEVPKIPLPHSSVYVQLTFTAFVCLGTVTVLDLTTSVLYSSAGALKRFYQWSMATLTSTNKEFHDFSYWSSVKSEFFCNQMN